MQLKALKRCAPNYRTRQQMRGIEEGLGAGRVLAIAHYRRLTPYGRWAIPGWCVIAESGGSWGAHNPTSAARGAYQLLGHGEPWPVNSMADKMVHHRIARDLYLASGLNPWTACS